MKVADKETQLTLWCLDALAQMIYFSHLNSEYCPMIARKLPASNLKDVVIYYGQNQVDWKRKLLRALKGFKTGGLDLHEGMMKDLEDTPIMAFFDILSDLKRGRDMEGVADVVKELVDVDDISSILPNLKAIIRNQKLKEAA